MSNHKPTHVGILGATSLLGRVLLKNLPSSNCEVYAFSRKHENRGQSHIQWCSLSPNENTGEHIRDSIPCWISVAPIWVISDYFNLLETSGCRRIIALSSTSLATKRHSKDVNERRIANRLHIAETRLVQWSQQTQVECIILRPTLIYGCGLDKNICQIMRFIRRYHFFPLLGEAQGLRQPVHASDVAQACQDALVVPIVSPVIYTLSGGEVLSYREMLSRIFQALEYRERYLVVSRVAFRIALAVLKFMPKYKHWSIAMVDRMNDDLIFDHSRAAIDLGYKPRPFILSACDII